MTCYPINKEATLWKCYDPAGSVCSSNCFDPPSCNTACETVTCRNGGTYDPEKKLCCQTYADGVNSPQTVEICCDFTVGFPICYRDGNTCGYGCSANVSPCGYGECFAPRCPNGMSYQLLARPSDISDHLYGCVNETNTKACYFDSADNARTCIYNGNICGRQCHKTGEDFCEVAFMKECALAGHCLQAGYAMTDGCICDGDVTTVDGINYCCPTGHTYINGACAIN